MQPFYLIWSDLVWFGVTWSGLVWSNLVWFGLVRSGQVWSGLVWFGLVWWFPSINSCPTAASQILGLTMRNTNTAALGAPVAY